MSDDREKMEIDTDEETYDDGGNTNRQCKNVDRTVGVRRRITDEGKYSSEIGDDDSDNEDGYSRQKAACKSVCNKKNQVEYFAQSSPDEKYSEKKFEKEEIVIKDIHNGNFSKMQQRLNQIYDFSVVKVLIFFNCFIKFDEEKNLPKFPKLKHLSFNKCDGDFYKLFGNQKTVEKITIINEDRTIDGFSHEDFNELVSKLPNMKHIVLKGAGTASYFSHGKYPFKIVILETDVISFNTTKHQEVKDESNDLLKSQKSTLKELRIKNLPSGSIGSDVIKFIFDEMKLKNFYYGNKGLIVNGEKQVLKEIKITAEQIHSFIALLKLYEDLKTITLILNENDINCEETTVILKLNKDDFNSITEMEVIDNSGCKRLLSFFQELFANLTYVQRFVLESQDRNINAILEYCLKDMKELVELHLDSKVPREISRLRIIRNASPKLNKLFVDKKIVTAARNEFMGTNVEINEYKLEPKTNTKMQ